MVQIKIIQFELKKIILIVKKKINNKIILKF